MISQPTPALAMKSTTLGIVLFLLVAVALPLLLLLALSVTQLHAGDGPGKAPAMTPESVKSGEVVFFEYCSGCHGRRADGRGPQSLNLKPKPQNLRNAQFVKHLPDERVYSSISGGVRGTAMPPFELTLTSEKRWNVIHYLRSLTADDPITLPNSLATEDVKADVKAPDAADAAIVEKGKETFRQYCANCHGAKADGNGVIAPNLVPQPRNLVVVTSWGEKPFIDYMSDARLFTSITNGVPGTSMQPWIKVLTDDERWGVITYLRARANSERSRSENIQ
jgi:mono/diheme cytochrome c family protein